MKVNEKVNKMGRFMLDVIKSVVMLVLFAIVMVAMTILFMPFVPIGE